MSNWIHTKLENIAQVNMGQSPDSNSVFDGNSNGSTPFLQGNAEFGSKYPSPIFSCNAPKKLCEAGDILISVRAPVGELNQAEKVYCIGRGLAAITPKNIERGFFWHLLKLNRDQLTKVAQGSTFDAISSKNLLELCLSLPSEIREQKTIATILDTIDEAIVAAEAQLAKQEKIKQGLLQDLLTRGIDETGQIRPHWDDRPDLYQRTDLGVIPKDWDIQNLDSLSSLITSGSRNWADFYSNVGALFIRIGNLTRENINLRFDSIVYVDLSTNKEGQRTKLSPCDILVSITADLGIVAVIPDDIGEAYINQHIALVRLNSPKVNSRFVGHFLAFESVQNYITKLNDVGAKAGLNLSAIRGLLTVVPNIEEQNLIVSYLDDAVNQSLDSKIEIKKLQKIKTGMMQDLLTGQRRVTPDLIRQVETLTGSA
jgi:type I restriction enzyme S subunit